MRKFTLAFATISVAAFVANSFAGESEEKTVPLDAIDKQIVEEPEYEGESPLYGLYVLDLENRTRVWAVLDHTNSKAGFYNVLFFDRNANGKLTDEGERIEAGEGNSFVIGDFTDPNTQAKHTNLKLRVSKEGNVMFSLEWEGEHRAAGGYAVKPGPYTRFGKSPAEAPILKPVGEGPFSFQTWMASETLKIGEEGRANDLKFFVGHAGLGKNTFTSVMHPFLPEDVSLLATLAYTTKSGEAKEITSTLKDRC